MPVNQIPPEIITSIISYRLGPMPDLGQYKALSAPVAVCKYWRNAICSFPLLWTTVSDVYNPQLRRVIFERSKTAPLHLSCLRPTNGFMEDIEAHTSRIKTLYCRVMFGGGVDEPFDEMGNPNQMISDFKSSSDILETLCLYRNGARAPLETARFGVVPANSKVLKTLELRGVPLTIQFTQLSTITNFSYANSHVRSEALLDFFAANPLLEDAAVQCINISDLPERSVVPLNHLRQLSLKMGDTFQNLLGCLRLPSTSRIDLFVNSPTGGKQLWELLPPSLHDLPGIANTTLLHCKFTSEHHLILIGSNPDGGTIAVRGHPTQLFAGKPVNLQPLNLDAVREFVLSSRTRSLSSTWCRFRPTIREMTGVRTLVVGNRIAIRDLPVKDSLPNLSEITLVTPLLSEVASFVSSILVRTQTPGLKKIEYLEVFGSQFDVEHLVEAVKRPLEGYVDLVEIKTFQDGDDIDRFLR